MIRDYENCCRLCLSKDQLLHIFNQDEEETKIIAPKILYCCSLFVFQQDPFSKHLCFRCLCKLEETWTFQQKCYLANETLVRALSDDPIVKCSEQYVKSIENATKRISMHDLLSHRTPERAAEVYQLYQSVINFSVKFKNVELIDICSDDEADSKEQLRSLLRRDSRSSHSSLSQNQLNSRSLPISVCSQPDSTTKSLRRSVSSDVSDDASSSISDRTSRSQNTKRATEDKERSSCLRLSREAKGLKIDMNSNVKTSGSAQKSKPNGLKGTSGQKQLDLRSLRPLLKKGKRSSSSSRADSPDNRSSRSRSPDNRSRRSSVGSRSMRSSVSNDNGLDSFGSMESLSTIDSDITTNCKKTLSKRPSTQDAKPVPKSSGQKRKLNGQLSICDKSNTSKEVDSAPPAKKPKTLENEGSSAVTSSVNDVKKDKFNCKYCKKGFTFKTDKKNHTKKCKEKKIINCKYCLKRLYRDDDLLRHNLCHVKVDLIRLPPNRYCCSNCSRYFYPKAALKNHRKTCNKSKSSVENKWKNDSSDSSSEDSEPIVEQSADDPQTSGHNPAFSTISDNPNCRDFRTKRTVNRVDLRLQKIKFSKTQPKSYGLNMETSSDYVNTLCKYCRDVFDDADELWKHMVICHKYVNVHSPLRPDSESLYRCTEENCKRKFASLKDLISHVQTHILLKCHYCDFTTFKFYLMARHSNECEKNPEKGRWVMCCRNKFSNSHSFYVHKMFDCGLNKALLENSIANSKLDQSVKCGVCSKKFGSIELLSHLMEHARSNLGSDSSDTNKKAETDQAAFFKIFELCPQDWSKENTVDTSECVECKDTFLSLETFHEHMKKCHILSCSNCKLTFSNNLNFIMHNCVDRCKLCLSHITTRRHTCLARKVLTPGPKGKLKCSICKTVLVNILSSRNHILQHFPIDSSNWRDNVKCQICKEKFSNELTLDIHHYLKHRPPQESVQLARLQKPVKRLSEEVQPTPADSSVCFEPLEKLSPEDIACAEMNEKISSETGEESQKSSKEARIDVACQTCGPAYPGAEFYTSDDLNNLTFGRSISSLEDVPSEKSCQSGYVTVGCQTPWLTLPPDPPNINVGYKDCKTPEKCSSAVPNSTSPSCSKTLLSSPRYKVGGKDMSWRMSCTPTSPDPSRSVEINSLLS